MSFALSMMIHLLAAVVWVGGMFFAYVALRPVAASLLEPPVRLTLWSQTFARFFPWVWVAVLALPASGYWMAFKMFNTMASFPLYVHLMQGIGIVMMLMFLHVYFAPFRRLRQAVAAEDWPTGAKKLAQIRLLIGINLTLGLILIAIAAGGEHLL